MLYFSRPIGGGVGPAMSHPTMGLKINQVRQMPNNGDPEATGEAMQHRELINWQLGGRSAIRLSDMRLQLGHRVTWDLSRGSFGKTAPSITLEPGSLRGAAATAPHTQLGGPRSAPSIERIGVTRTGERNMA
ncbi:MAG TPA: hypothetical protein VFB37_08510, partial [Steroidobacteraceae bacterium]|nr:hypothetical protein [Steroidobacteraceae bacterium]